MPSTANMPNPQGTLLKPEHYDFFNVPAQAFAATVGICELPIVNGGFAAPFASLITRNGITYTLTSAGQTTFQKFAVQALAESTATNLVAQGYAPVIMGATAATATFAAYVVYQIGDFTYKCYLSAHEARMLAEMRHPPLHSNVIAKDTLQQILDTYQTHSKTRSCLSFFMGKDSLEISLLKTFLENHKDDDFINLNDLAKALCKGKQPRIQALTNHEKITSKIGPISGTDRIINEIIENSISLADAAQQKSSAAVATP